MSNILRDSLCVSQNENVLLITDDIEIVRFFSSEAKSLGIDITNVLLTKESRPIKELSKPIESAIKSSSVILTVMKRIPQELHFRVQCIKTVETTKFTRLAHMPDVDMDIINNCILQTDFTKLEELGHILVEVLARAKDVRIQTKKGTDFRLSLGGWNTVSDGDFTKIQFYGEWKNLPLGEVFKVPEEDTAHGVLVIDGAIPGKAFSKNEHIILNMSEGKIIEIDDNSESKFEDYLREIENHSPEKEKGNIYKVCEFGIGINEKARTTSNSVEYEKRLGTIHIALGDNIAFKGKIEAQEHLDLLIEDPTLTINGIKVMDNGKFIENGIDEIVNEDLYTYKPQNEIKINDETKIQCSNVAGIFKIEDSKLFRKWIGHGKMPFITKVGNAETSSMAAKVMKKINEKSIYFRDLINTTNLSMKNCENLVRILYDFHLIQLKDNSNQ